ncbi:MAG: serine protease AprX [Candidatus Paceibacteria bacterium]|jgi:serine protease AprX
MLLTPTLLALLALPCPQDSSLPMEAASQLVTSQEAGQFLLSTVGGEIFHRTPHQIENLERVDFPAGDGFVALWEEVQSGVRVPHYIVQRASRGFARVRETDYQIHMKRGIFDPAHGHLAFENTALSPAGDLHLVQFVCPPVQEFRDELARMGAVVRQFIPNHTRIVQMNSELAAEVAALSFVRWVGPYEATYRLEQELLDGLANGELSDATHCYLQVFESGPAMKARLAAKLSVLGAPLLAQIPDGSRLEALLTPEQLVQAAAFDEVLFIDRWSAPEEDVNKVRNVGGANALETIEGFTGQGVRGEVVDGNVRDSHASFQHDALLLHGNHSGDTGHGTSTTGLVFGDGTGNATGRGVLPSAQGIFADYSFLSNRYNHTAQLLQAPYFAVFQSNSWGGSLTTAYNSTSNQMDQILFDMDITILQSQSNTGNQSSRPQAWAKNIISVGAVRHLNTATLADDNWGGSGSIGPAADGRVKPDLCFWYDSILAPSNTNDTSYTGNFGGTSASTPCTAGFVGLVQQMWSQGLFGNTPVGSTVFERRAKSPTVRALLVKSATQYTFSGTSHDKARVHQGWGLPDVSTLHDNKDSMLVVNEEDLLLEGMSRGYQLIVPAGFADFKATLVYSDPAGTTSASKHRINDLSLRVTDPLGTTYWGNRGLKANNWSSAGGNSNTTDVIENVFVQAAQPGFWVVEVIADEINQDGHVETGALDVDYALVVSGITEGINCLAPTKYCSAKLTSLFTLPSISHLGVPSVSSGNFQVTVESAVPNKNALVFWGPGSASAPLQGGTLCVQTPLTRGSVLTTDAMGSAVWDVDLSGEMAGTAEFYQIWFRDPQDLSGFGSGLSDGLAVTYCQ